MSNLDNQPGNDGRRGFSKRSPDSQTGLDGRKTGMGTGTITAIVAAIVIAGALMLFGPWGNNRTAVSNSTPAASNPNSSTTTGQNSSAPRVITPTVRPSDPTTPAPATTR